METLDKITLLIPKADGIGAFVLAGTPEGVVVTDGPTGDVLSDTRPVEGEAR